MKKGIDFKIWNQEIEKVWDLQTGDDCITFCNLMEVVTGKENIKFTEKLIDAINVKEDNGVYESLYNALWLFPSYEIGKLLSQKLPILQKRMGKYGQVGRFYLPLGNKGEAQDSFIKESTHWTEQEKKTAIKAIKEWSIEDERWEEVLGKVGISIKITKEDAIPDEWPHERKNRLTQRRQEMNEGKVSKIFRKGGKKEWLDDVDFIIAFLILNHGKHWREIDTITNPLRLYAKTTVTPSFIDKLKNLPRDKLTKLLNNIKKVNKRKYKDLITQI